MGPAVEARKLSVAHRGRGAIEAIRGVDLDLDPGTATALIGPNGAGKSTLLRTIAGYLPPCAGQIRVGGASPKRYRRHRGIGYVPENPAPPCGWTVSEWIEASWRLRGTNTRHALREAAAALDSLGVEHLLGDRVDRLSWGTTRRVALAFAFAGEPTLVLVDEPFAGLDTAAARRVTGVLRGLSVRGATVLISLHDEGTALTIASQVIRMEGGRVGK